MEPTDAGSAPSQAAPAAAASARSELKKALQLRFDPELYAQLKLVSGEVGASMNRLVTEAVQAYVAHLTAQLDDELQETLRRLRAYADSPGAVDRDLAAFVEAEVGQADPLEATRVDRVHGLRRREPTEAERELAAIVGGLG